MDTIYLGRIVAVAVTPQGRPVALYRVSSRSFPNRVANMTHDRNCVSIVPRPGHETDISKNPYIAYNCARLVGNKAILANGSHTDPIAEKVGMGMPVRDAIALSLLAMDYEKDDYSTPRIVAVADAGTGLGWLGTVRHDGMDVRCFKLQPGRVAHLSTYEHTIPSDANISDFPVEKVEEACRFAIDGGVFAGFSNPVTAVAAVGGESGFVLGAMDTA